MNNHRSTRRAALLCSLIFSCSAVLLVIASPAENEELAPSRIETAISAAGPELNPLVNPYAVASD